MGQARDSICIAESLKQRKVGKAMAILTGASGAPEIDPRLLGRYARITKANWADLYFDLYREVRGEDAGDAEVMADAEGRLDVLKRYREAGMRGYLAGSLGERCFLCGGAMPMGRDRHECYLSRNSRER
jgi:hypothetical protein